MDRRNFLTLAGSTLAAALLSPRLLMPAGTPEQRQPPPARAGGLGARVYCGNSVNARGRFRHYLVNGRRITERVTA